MTTQYFIVEGPFEKFLLERILPESIVAHSKILTGNGYNIALSKARSLLVSSELPVALIVDADTTDTTSVEEKKDFLSQSLQQFSNPDHFHIFLAVPEMEQIFFSRRDIVEELLGKPIPDQQWEIANYHPGQVLRELLHTQDMEASLQSLLTPSVIEKLRNTEFVQDIIQSSSRTPKAA
jgi:hypothetical protein